MKVTRGRRAGATETFSVSVDPDTKRALRAFADAEFGGNMSALVTDLAEEARRRMGAAEFLRGRGIPKMTATETAEVEARIDREVATWRAGRKSRGAA